MMDARKKMPHKIFLLRPKKKTGDINLGILLCERKEKSRIVASPTSLKIFRTQFGLLLRPAKKIVSGNLGRNVVGLLRFPGVLKRKLNSINAFYGENKCLDANKSIRTSEPNYDLKSGFLFGLSSTKILYFLCF